MMALSDDDKVSPVKDGADDQAGVFSVDYYSVRICKHWHGAAENILDVARLCAEANRNLFSTSREALLSELPFSESTFSKLVKIGNDKRFRDPELVKLLPPSFSTLYEISGLSVTKLTKAMEQGLITPRLKRSEVKRWKSGARSIAAETQNLPLFASIYLLENCIYEDQDEIDRRLCLMAESLRVKIIFNSERREQRSFCTEQKNKWRLGLKEARRIVRDAKKKYKSRHGRDWNYTQSEIAIPSDATIQEAQEVVELIDRIDEFEKFLTSEGVEFVPREFHDGNLC